MVLHADLILDNSSGVYTPGQVLSGRAVLTLSDRSLIKALALKISGYAGTRWEKARKQKKPKEPKPKKNGEQSVPPKQKPVKPPTVYTNREDYLSTLNYFMGSEDATPKMVEAGTYHYTFSVRLPGNCPSSYESEFGHVRYNLDFFIEYPEHRHTAFARSVFVYAQRDLREDGIAMRPLDLAVPERKSFLKYWQTPLQLDVHIPQSGYISGEGIAVNVKVQNNDLLTLTEIVYTLYRVSTYSGVAPKQKPKVEVQRTNLLHTVHTLFGQNGSVVSHSQLLQVPQTPPTTDAALCKCLQISYEVDVRVNSVRRKRLVCATLPILIGTISLHSDVKVVPSEQLERVGFVAAPAPTMLVARSMGDLTSIQEDEANAFGAATAPSAPSAAQEEMANIGASMSSLASVFREADFMSTTNLNKKSKHTMSGDNLDFKPKYLYYEMNNDIQEQQVSSTAANTSISNGQNLYPSLP